jgi:hypothetical protein
MSTHPIDEDDSNRDLQVSVTQDPRPSRIHQVIRVEYVEYGLDMLEGRWQSHEDEAAGGNQSRLRRHAV